MYEAHFGLKEGPFSISPDPGYLYLSPRHQEGLAHLLYGVGPHGGFVQLTGEVGTGKTTLIRALLDQDNPDVDFALVLNPRLSALELVADVCTELGIAVDEEAQSLKSLVDALNRHLLASHAAGRQTVVIIDEAQNLSSEVLEQIRLLTNLETHKHKLLRIVLVGQPELDEMLSRRELRQLAQRITIRFHLTPLDRTETRTYIQHRSNIAGGRLDLFSDRALAVIHKHSGGVPRLINVICDRALLGAYSRQASQVDGAVAKAAAKEVLRGNRPAKRAPVWPWAITAGALVLAGVALAWALRPVPEVPVAAASSVQPPIAEPAPVEPVVENPVSPETSVNASIEPIADSLPREETLAADGENEEPFSLAVPEPDPEPEPEPEPTLDDLLASPGFNDTLPRLLGSWLVLDAGAPNQTPCQQAELAGLRCLAASGDWSAVRAYDRPVVMTLRHGSARVDVLLSELGEDQAVLERGKWQVAVDLAEVDRYWTGEFLMLWRPPSGVAMIGPKSDPTMVRWLRERLATVDGLASNASPVFDGELLRRVKAFQQRHGLGADGISGPLTLPLLNNLVPDQERPRLTWTGGD